MNESKHNKKKKRYESIIIEVTDSFFYNLEKSIGRFNEKTKQIDFFGVGSNAAFGKFVFLDKKQDVGNEIEELDLLRAKFKLLIFDKFVIAQILEAKKYNTDTKEFEKINIPPIRIPTIK